MSGHMPGEERAPVASVHLAASSTYISALALDLFELLSHQIPMTKQK